MLIILLLAVIACCTIAINAEPCIVTDEKGTAWDLTKFSNKDNVIIDPLSGPSFAIVYRTCGKTSLSDCRGGNSCFIEQSPSLSRTIFSLSKWEASGMTVTAVPNDDIIDGADSADTTDGESKKDSGVKIQFLNGDFSPKDTIPFSIIFKCGQISTSSYTVDYSTLKYGAIVEDKSFCENSSLNISIGWISMTILLLVTVFSS